MVQAWGASWFELVLNIAAGFAVAWDLTVGLEFAGGLEFAAGVENTQGEAGHPC